MSLPLVNASTDRAARGNVAFVALACGATILFGGLAAAASGNSLGLLALVVLVSAAQWVALQHSSGQSVPLPGLAVVGLNLVGALGWLYYPSIADRAAVSMVLPTTSEIYDTAAAIFITTSACIFIGGLVGGGRVHAERSRTLDQVQAAVSLADRVLPARLAAVAALPLVLQVAAYSPAGLIHRGHYSDTFAPQIIVIAATILTPAGMALAALLLFRDGPEGASRQVGGFLVGGFGVVLFCMGTRQLAMLPMMVMLAWMLKHRGERVGGPRAALVILVSLAVTLVFLQLPLSLRNMSSGAGLIPYLDAIAKTPGALFSFDVPRIMGNILFSVPLAGTTAHLPSFPQGWFLTSINPLPSAFTDWVAIKGGLRLNLYTPASGLGELQNYSVLHLCSFMFVLGLLLARIQAWNMKLPPAKAALSTVVGIGLTGATVLNLMQYNLRTGARDIWYLLLISMLLHATGKVQTSVRSGRQ